MKVRTNKRAPGAVDPGWRERLAKAEHRALMDAVRLVPDLSRGSQPPTPPRHVDDYARLDDERRAESAASPRIAWPTSQRAALIREGGQPSRGATGLPAEPRFLPSDLQHGRNGASLRALRPAHRDPWFWVAIAISWLILAGVIVSVAVEAGS